MKSAVLINGANGFSCVNVAASGYLLTRTPHAQILAAIEDVQKGGSPMTSSIARQMAQSIQQIKDAPGSSRNSALAHISPREHEILTHLSQGYRYNEIADALGIGVETVRTHLRRIYEKLHVTSRTEAAVKFLAK